MNKYLFNILITIDQGFNVILFFGEPDETISARLYRNENNKYYKPFRKIVDFIFLHLFNQKNHCQSAFNSELIRSDLPKRYKDIRK